MLTKNEVLMDLESVGFFLIKIIILLESGNVMASNKESEWEHTARLLFTGLMETKIFFVAGEEVTSPGQIVEALKNGRPLISLNKKI
tara:strand:- start:225 stop:485 length:261 start_codon:yes stop_codon:yes gene_type:complete